jgi:para-aminobenzoate synthetase / 4-amino-4-deoxychorismate lyase
LQRLQSPATAGSFAQPAEPLRLPPPVTVSVRLDSLDAARGPRSFRFGGLREVLRADTLSDVLPVLARAQAAADAGLHAAGFVAYEAAPAFDPAFRTHPPDPRLPLAWFAVYETRRETASDEAPPFDAEPPGAWRSPVSEAAYQATVERIRDLIAAGDTYQVNLTFPLRAPFRGDAEALYARLCRAQRAAYCALLRLGDISIVSLSPELFFRAADGTLELRPMKGTRPRGRWVEEDDALAAELAASPKDRAENLMIVDLLRNDAGRVAEVGSVRVERLFEVERYETVHQLTSTIRSDLRPDADLPAIFRALFPCGSVTGAPKVRTTEIIADVEDAPRGVYTGAIGVVSPREMVFSVAIRTLLLDHAAGTAELGVGSGITHDSAPAAEYRECLEKAAFVHHEPRSFQLLETMLWKPDDGFFLLDGHLHRLLASARYFGFRADEGEIRRALQPPAAAKPHRVRLLLARDGTVHVEAAPLVPSPPEPLRVAISDDAVDSRDAHLYHKTTLRDPYDRRLAARPDCDDVLLLNERGEVTESTLANLVVRLDDALWTPPLTSGLLPGVMRAAALAAGDVRERVLRPDDLTRAQEIWLINSVRKWRRAELV